MTGQTLAMKFQSGRTVMAALGMLTAALGAGCMLIPAYQRPIAPVASQFPGAASPTAAPPVVSAAGLSWRAVFADERLQALIDLALVTNRDLRIATLNVEQSHAQYRLSRASLLPAIKGNGGYSAQYTEGLTTRQWDVSLGTSAYILDFFGKTRSLNTEAFEQFLATEEARRSAWIALVAEVATQYSSWREAEAQLALANQTLIAVEDSLQLNKVRFEAGEANELDLRSAEGEVQTAQINVHAYERQLGQARNALELLLGAPIPSSLPAPRPFEASQQTTAIPAGMPSDLLEHRPDILQAEHALRAANANIGAARADFFPSITLTGLVGKASPQLSGLFATGSAAWNFAPQITLPLFDAGANRASLDVARTQARIDVAQYEKAIQTAFREVADALVANSSYAQEIDTETAAIEIQRRRLFLATLRYRQGEDSYLNVLSAQQDLYGAQQGLLSAQYNRIASQISLYQALGGGWQ
jgi:outer membrane protein, multidrug efflux system